MTKRFVSAVQVVCQFYFLFSVPIYFFHGFLLILYLTICGVYLLG